MAEWTVRDIPDLSGKTVVVTGANSGLGFESAKAMAGKGAEVVLACRSSARGEAALCDIRAGVPTARLHAMTLDLQDLQSVAAFAASFKRQRGALHILMNNAGIMNTPYGLTRDGFESQLGTNHLGHFALTGLLMEALRTTPGSRVITVTSSGHRAGKMDFGNLLFDGGRDYAPLRAYGRSKLANLLFAYELQRRLQRAAVPCMSLAAHPGASQTNLGRHIEGAMLFRVLNPLLTRVVQGPAQGALSQLRAALDPAARGGEYYGPGGLAEMAGAPVRVRSSNASRSHRDATLLWAESERLTGIRYNLL